MENINKIAACGGVRLWLRTGPVLEGCDADVVYMDLFTPYKVGDYELISVPANHDAVTFPQHLIISDGDKKLFYALDGAWILNETTEYVKNAQFDAMVIDATVGDYSGDYRIGEHNSIPMIRLIVDSMKTLGIVNDSTDIILSHIACCLHKSHEETCKIVKSDGFVVAYDGMEHKI